MTTIIKNGTVATADLIVMLMFRCLGGLSHNNGKEISPAGAAAGTHVLLHTVLEVVR